MNDLFRHPLKKASVIPYHTQVRDRVLALIQAGTLLPGTKLPSEPEVAALMGVSRMTANKALLGLMNDGYLIREKGRGTFVAPRHQHRPGRLYVAVADSPANVLEDYYLGALYWHVHATFAKLGSAVSVVPLTADQPATPECGIVAINPPQPAVEELLDFVRMGASVVVLGANWSEQNLATVDSDNFAGASLAVDHLADLGHHRVLFLGGLPNDSNTIDRVRGFRAAAENRGLAAVSDDVLVVPEAHGFDLDTEDEIFRRLSRSDGPTAVFAGGPHLAIRLLAAAQRRGLRVPEDLSLVGYDDPSFMSLAYPGLTTIRQPLEDMAAAACRKLLERVDHESSISGNIMLAPDLLLRASTAPPMRALTRN